ncbi:hypothetical protein HYH03_004695 [Edaphochlamys debaryana]|uniref:C-CAP/cofactor C-like domain-containing protein n=1 Tax=Edaphochlamys debaryana TaxID=47281 RepID=A0A835YGB4_9CHLO|nr:hypothetical protein HYH03_004695 [Edaphochlamys debaryana]|eukprot:KAG2497104.1 hypothetical protein HYH03_004695 [Edaphochlamys debaryana]
MLESAPSSAGGSQSNLPVVFAHPHHPHGHGHHGHGQPHPRPDRLGAVLSARHLAHGGFRAGRVLVMHGVLPAARASALASRMALHATGRVALATGRALLGTAQRLQRFAMAPRVRVAQVDGAACLDPMQLVRLGSGDPAAMAVAAAAVAAAAPPPIANLTGARIALRHCRNTRLRIEYCSDCVVVASRLSNCELMLVGCTRIKLVLRDCSGLLLRELQCGSMGDFERRRCEGFSHEIVCLRCACKPSGSGGASPSTSEGVRMLTY